MDTQTKIRLGKKIHDLRKLNNYSMEEFGERIGVSRGVVNNYEKGRVAPRPKIQKKILSLTDKPDQDLTEFIFGTPREYLFEIFEGIDSLSNPFIRSGSSYLVGTVRDYPEVINILSKMLISGKLIYGNDSDIIRKAYELEPKLANDWKFAELYKKYNLEPFKFKIEENENYREILLPYLDKHLSAINDSDEFDLISSTIVSLISMDEYNRSIKKAQEMNRLLIPKYGKENEKIDLLKYFSKDELKDKSSSKKEVLEHYLDDFGNKLFWFIKSFDSQFALNFEEIFRYYEKEKYDIEQKYQNIFDEQKEK
ncbi:TPA: helix-turn-helix transcriptional regulator [Streptococcus agalactiae]|nr:helix-turn-helix transcriptional regulator [Streptococcus agalactiae]